MKFGDDISSFVCAAGIWKKCLNFSSRCPKLGHYVFTCVSMAVLWKNFSQLHRNGSESEKYFEISCETYWPFSL